MENEGKWRKGSQENAAENEKEGVDLLGLGEGGWERNREGCM